MKANTSKIVAKAIYILSVIICFHPATVKAQHFRTHLQTPPAPPTFSHVQDFDSQAFNPLLPPVGHDDDSRLIWAAHLGSGLAGGYNIPAAAVSDENGAIYIAAVSSSPPNSLDIITQKITLNGEIEWTARYGANTAGDDIPTAMVIDSSGSIFLTGYAGTAATGYDICTIKFSNQGVQEWVSLIDGGAGLNDFGTAVVALDSTIWVAGNIRPDSGASDIALLEFHPDGRLLQRIVYDGPAQSSDQAISLVAGRPDRLYISGQSKNASGDFDALLHCFSTPGGLNWERHFSGSGQGDDTGLAIATGDSGSVYIAAQLLQTGNNSDMAVRKYHPDGGFVWETVYDRGGFDRPAALITDSSGTSYVTGISSNSNSGFDITTLKINADGQIEWVEHYHTLAPGYNEPTAIARDASGMIYVGGFCELSSGFYDYTMLKYHPSGQLMWSRHSGSQEEWDLSTALTTTPDGRITQTGFSGILPQYRLRTRSYSPSGQVVWNTQYQGPGTSYDRFHQLLPGPDQSLLLAGQSLSNMHGEDLLLAKYDINGQELWHRTYNHSDARNESTIDLAISPHQKIYLLGNSIDSLQHSLLLIRCYDLSGQLIWQIVQRDHGGESHFGAALATGSQGQVYAAGHVLKSSGTFDIVLLRINHAGNVDWLRQWDSPYQGNDQARAMAVDNAGNIYVSGISESPGSPVDFVTLKYSPAGRLIWAERYDEGGGSAEFSNKLLYRDNDELYLAGDIANAGGVVDYILIKYDTSGQALWNRRYDGPAHDEDRLNAMAADASGNIYLTGYSYANGSTYDYATVKFSAAGQQLWVARYDGPASRYDEASALAIANDSLLLVSGYSYDASSFYDIVTIGYDLEGRELWQHRYDGPGNDLDRPYAITITEGNQAVLAGFSRGTAWQLGTILSLRLETLTSTRHAGLPQGRTFHLQQNYPNPFNPRTQIRFHISVQGHYKLIVYDILGRPIRTLLDKELTPGPYVLDWDGQDNRENPVASGVYFYTLSRGTESSIKKAILVR